MSDDARLFTVVVEQAQTFEELLNNLAAAIERRDSERVRLLSALIEAAVMLGHRAVVAARWQDHT